MSFWMWCEVRTREWGVTILGPELVSPNLNTALWDGFIGQGAFCRTRDVHRGQPFPNLPGGWECPRRQQVEFCPWFSFQRKANELNGIYAIVHLALLIQNVPLITEPSSLANNNIHYLFTLLSLFELKIIQYSSTHFFSIHPHTIFWVKWNGLMSIILILAQNST